MGEAGVGGGAAAAGPLWLAAGLRGAMCAHARRERPLEACGLLAGEGVRASAFFPTRNALASPTRYDIAPQDLLRVTMDLEARGQGIWGIFHSHPTTAAYPSPTDVRLAFYPEAYYLICSLADPAAPVLRAFRITDGQIQEYALCAEDAVGGEGAGGGAEAGQGMRP